MKLERLLLASLLCVPALAAPDVADLAGSWKRINSKDQSETVLVFELDGDTLVSSLEGLEDGLECTGRFKLKGEVLRGKVRWVDTKFDTDSTVPWKFTFKEDDKARGSCGWLDTSYEPFKRGYTIYYLERIEDDDYGDDTGSDDTGSDDYGDDTGSDDSGSGEREGWITSDGGEEPYGDPVSANTLYGGWSGPGGPWVVNSRDGESLTLKPSGHSDGVSMLLEDDRGIFRGEVSYAGGTSKVELSFDDGRLVGRSSWTEGGEEGWAPVSFDRLTRYDLGHASDKMSIDPGTDGEIAGAYRREDGLYLRLNGEGEGELVAKDGTLSCRVRLQNDGGVWTGTGNWEGVETKWELARTADGLEGRCEWVDAHEGTIVVRGWSKRSFTSLKRAN